MHMFLEEKRGFPPASEGYQPSFPNPQKKNPKKLGRKNSIGCEEMDGLEDYPTFPFEMGVPLKRGGELHAVFGGWCIGRKT